MTGAGGSAGHNVCWSLRVSPDGKKLDITGTDTDRTSLQLNNWVDNAYRIAGAEEPSYVTVLAKIVKRRRVEAVFPQPDGEVSRLSNEREKIGAALFLPDASTVTLCLDKYEALLKWQKAGLRLESVLVNPEPPSVLRKFKSLKYPVWLRARKGAGGLLSCLVRTWKEAYYWVMFHWEHGIRTDFVAEEYLPGRDYCFMSLWREGSLVTSMVRERLSWVGNRAIGTGGTSKLNRVVHSEQVNNNAVKSIKSIDRAPHGIFCVDMKEDHRGIPRPTEVNCRFTTNVHYLTLAAIRLGRPEFNFPWLAARIAMGEEIPTCKALDALPSDLWFTKNTDMGYTLVQDEKWRAADFT